MPDKNHPAADRDAVTLVMDSGSCTLCSPPKLVGDTRTQRRSHMRNVHGLVLMGSKNGQAPLVEGETVLIGRRPVDVLQIVFTQGSTRRRIETWAIDLADAVDLVAGHLRQQLERRAK
jgi:hypothetical protein